MGDSMKALGIICEYNPLHNGHIYHIQEALHLSNADCIIAIMSGDYVQRGEPAILDKYTRTQIALDCGADFVVELPAYYALSSAECFAKGALSICHALYVDSICFGSECNHIDMLQTIAEFLVNDSTDYKNSLKKYLTLGNSFANSRNMAVTDILGANYGKILEEPNNILGVEYIKAILKNNYNIKPLTIIRTGNGYNNYSDKGTYLSASGIREALKKNKPIDSYIPQSTLQLIETYKNQSQDHNFIHADDFSSFLLFQLSNILFEAENNKYQASQTVSSAKNYFVQYMMRFIDVTPDLAASIYNHAIQWYTGSCNYSFSSFAESIKTKNYALSRIKRILFRIILGFDKEKSIQYDTLPYIKILGFNQKGRTYLKSIKKSVSIPIVTKTADYKDLLFMDIHAANIYNYVYKMQHNILILNDYVQSGNMSSRLFRKDNT